MFLSHCIVFVSCGDKVKHNDISLSRRVFFSVCSTFWRGLVVLVFLLQEEKLVEKDCAVWRLQGEPTILVTLAHIFNHFAPLMVKQVSLFVFLWSCVSESAWSPFDNVQKAPEYKLILLCFIVKMLDFNVFVL